NRYFSKKDKQMASKHIKRYSTSLIIKEIHTKIKMRYHLISTRVAILKRKCEGCGHYWQEYKMVQLYGKPYWLPQKISEIELPYDLPIIDLAVFPKERKSVSK
ncbi:LORF2 protein, partial [Crocuta crocuta]